MANSRHAGASRFYRSNRTPPQSARASPPPKVFSTYTDPTEAIYDAASKATHVGTVRGIGFFAWKPPVEWDTVVGKPLLERSLENVVHVIELLSAELDYLDEGRVLIHENEIPVFEEWLAKSARDTFPCFNSFELRALNLGVLALNLKEAAFAFGLHKWPDLDDVQDLLACRLDSPSDKYGKCKEPFISSLADLYSRVRFQAELRGSQATMRDVLHIGKGAAQENDEAKTRRVLRGSRNILRAMEIPENEIKAQWRNIMRLNKMTAGPIHPLPGRAQSWVRADELIKWWPAVLYETIQKRKSRTEKQGQRRAADAVIETARRRDQKTAGLAAADMGLELVRPDPRNAFAPDNRRTHLPREKLTPEQREEQKRRAAAKREFTDSKQGQ